MAFVVDFRQRDPSSMTLAVFSLAGVSGIMESSMAGKIKPTGFGQSIWCYDFVLFKF
jgi:hypothetical protein